MACRRPKRRLLVFTRFPKEYEPVNLSLAGDDLSLAPTVIRYDDLLLGGERGKKNTDISAEFAFKPSDLVILRSSAHFQRPSLFSVKQKLMEQIVSSRKCLNYQSFHKYPLISKLTQAQALSKAGLGMIPTTHLASFEAQRAYFEKANFPMILKGRFGSHSRRVFRVEDQQEAWEVGQKLGQGILAQPLYESEFYWRVIVLGGKGLGVMRRQTNGRFFKSGYQIDIKESRLIRLAQKAAGVFGAELAGIDLIASPQGDPVVIEINRTPQFKVFDRYTQSQTAHQIVGYLLSK